MEILEQKINLKSSCDLIGKGKDIFSPLKEAIKNSLDAISQRQNAVEAFTPSISVAVHFRTEKNLLKEETHTLDFIMIKDNGIGFTSENLSRFKEPAANTKGLNNRGTGKIQIFCRFKEISIDSALRRSPTDERVRRFLPCIVPSMRIISLTRRKQSGRLTKTMSSTTGSASGRKSGR
ncbi:MAG: ATP-binding protein [Rickettsiales bacterium]|nr:ATP-binding protein [Rickettsiales bacterium]